MENTQKANVLPYARGGVPGALRAFILAEMVLSIIGCVVSAVSSVIALRGGGWPVLITIPLTIYGTVLSVRLYKGVNSLYRGQPGGADLAQSACRGRRVMLTVVLVLGILLVLVTAAGGRGFNVLVFLLAVGLLIAAYLPVIFYFSDAETIFAMISREEYDGQPKQVGGVGRFAVLCIMAAAVSAAAAVLLGVGVLDSGSASILNVNLRYAQDLYIVYLYLCCARFLLTFRCYRGFMKAHSGMTYDSAPSFSGAGYSLSPVICVIGSIGLGWSALNNLMIFLKRIISSIRHGGRFYQMDALYNPATLLLLAAYVLLGIALQRGRKWQMPALVGTAGMIACNLYYTIRNLMRMLSLSGSDVYDYLAVGMEASQLVFFAMLLAAIILRRRGKPVPRQMRGIMIALAVLSTVMAVGYNFSLRFSDLRYFQAEYLFLVFANLIDELMLMLGMLGLIRLTDMPEEPREEEKQIISGLP